MKSVLLGVHKAYVRPVNLLAVYLSVHWCHSLNQPVSTARRGDELVLLVRWNQESRNHSKRLKQREFNWLYLGRKS